jgi:hypothetical protein
MSALRRLPGEKKLLRNDISASLSVFINNKLAVYTIEPTTA